MKPYLLSTLPPKTTPRTDDRQHLPAFAHTCFFGFSVLVLSILIPKNYSFHVLFVLFIGYWEKNRTNCFSLHNIEVSDATTRLDDTSHNHHYQNFPPIFGTTVDSRSNGFIIHPARAIWSRGVESTIPFSIMNHCESLSLDMIGSRTGANPTDWPLPIGDSRSCFAFGFSFFRLLPNRFFVYHQRISRPGDSEVGIQKSLCFYFATPHSYGGMSGRATGNFGA